MIDIHSHILPSLDDGPRDLATAVAMAQAAVADGIRKMVATPHYLSYGWSPSIDEIRTTCDSLKAELRRNSIDLDLTFAAEVRIVEDLVTRVQAGEIATLDPCGRYLLLELPRPGNCFDYLRRAIFDLRLNDITPVIAHPEYCATFLDHPSFLRQVADQGALFQVTASSVVDSLRTGRQDLVSYMLREGLVQVLATDAHDLSIRKPVLSEAHGLCVEALGNTQADRLVDINPGLILDGEDIPPSL